MAKSTTARARRCLKNVSSRYFVVLLLISVFMAASLGGYSGLLVGTALSSGAVVVALSATLGAVLGATLAVFCFRLCRGSGTPNNGNDSSDDEFDVEFGFDVGECLCGDDSDDDEEECCWDPSDPCACDWEVFFQNLIKRILNVTCTLVCNLFCCCSEDDDNSSTTSSKSHKTFLPSTPPEPITIKVPKEQQFEEPPKRDSPSPPVDDASPDKALETEKESTEDKINRASFFNRPYELLVGPLFSLWGSVTNYELFVNQDSSNENEPYEEKGNKGENK